MDVISKAEAKRIADQEAEWRAQSDLSDLRRAEAIKADKARISAARAIAKREAAALQRIAQASQPKKTTAKRRGK